MTPVTIGDQKFIKDKDKGWVDSKTKQPADKGLIRLLDSLVIDEPLVKKLRVKIDKRVEPITIHGQKFVFDSNQGWIDEKTKVRVPESLQLVLSNASPRFGKNDSPDIDLSAGFGMAGQAGLQKTKTTKPPVSPKTGGGAFVKNRNTNINAPLVAMIHLLASIDGYLKQELQNKQLIASKELAEAKEIGIENKPIADYNQIEESQQDATKVPSKLGAVGGAAAIMALIAMQYDPVKDTLQQIADFGIGIGNFVGDIAKTLNSGFEWLLSSKDNKQDINDLSLSSAPTQKTSNTQPETAEPTSTVPFSTQQPSAAPVEPQAPPGNQAQQPQTNKPVSMVAPTPIKSNGTIPSAPRSNTSSTISRPSGSGSASTAARPATTAPKPATPVAKPVSSSPTAAAPAKKVGAEPVSAGTGKMSQHVGKLFVLGGGLTGNSRNLQNWDPKFESSVVGMLREYVAAGNAPPVMTSGYRYPGDQARISTGYTKAAPGTSRHERGLAVDFNSSDVHRMRSMGLLAKYGLSQPMPARDPVHIQQAGAAVGGTDPVYSAVGEDGGMAADLAGPVISAIAETFEMGKKLFGKVGAALVGAQNYEGPSKTAGIASFVKAGAIEKTSATIDSRTPAPVPSIPRPVSPPNINPDKSSPMIQTPATTSDMSSINYYLERFGFAPAESELSR